MYNDARVSELYVREPNIGYWGRALPLMMTDDSKPNRETLQP